MAKISIVMPTYNQVAFIDQAIESILVQSFKDFELIIVNDGSTDDTLSHIIKYKDERIRLAIMPHEGTGAALNTGFKLSEGIYETWFASDNVLYPKALEEMCGFLSGQPETDLVYTNFEIGIMDASGLIELSRKNVKSELLSQRWDPVYFKKRDFVGIIWLWKRWLREACGEFQHEPCEDYDMLLRMAEIGKFAFLDQCLGWYRRHPKNITQTKALPQGLTAFVQEKAKRRSAQ